MVKASGDVSVYAEPTQLGFIISEAYVGTLFADCALFDERHQLDAPEVQHVFCHTANAGQLAAAESAACPECKDQSVASVLLEL